MLKTLKIPGRWIKRHPGECMLTACLLLIASSFYGLARDNAKQRAINLSITAPKAKQFAAGGEYIVACAAEPVPEGFRIKVAKLDTGKTSSLIFISSNPHAAAYKKLAPAQIVQFNYVEPSKEVYTQEALMVSSYLKPKILRKFEFWTVRLEPGVNPARELVTDLAANGGSHAIVAGCQEQIVVIDPTGKNDSKGIFVP